MPSLSERDLGHVEKLFNAIRSVLDYDRTHRTYPTPAMPPNKASPAPQSPPPASSAQTATGKGAARRPDRPPAAPAASPVTPSRVLQDHQEQHSERSYTRINNNSSGGGGGAAGSSSTAAGVSSSGVSERRLWAELAFLLWRVAGLQKLSLMAFVTSDPGEMLAEIARALLSFLKESCAAAAGMGKEARMRQVALLAQDRLLFLLRVFCNLKNCTVMVSDTSGSGGAAEGRRVFDAICSHVVAGQHFSWMSQIYVWFCDEAAWLARCSGAVPSAYVYATHDALRCILGCCTDQAACARAFLHSEPVACVTYMFYGLKLRISLCDVLRPYEDDHALKEAPAGLGNAGSLEALPAPSGVGSSGGGLPPRGASATARADEDKSQQQQQLSGPIPLRPPGARYLKTRYFTALTASSGTTTSGSHTHREGPIVVNCSAVAGLVRPSAAAAVSGGSVRCGNNTSSSWAFDLPDLNREQLKQLLLGGRENAFDALLFAALDVVVEVLRVTRDYDHWMVLSTVSNLLLLSKRSIEDVPSPSPSSSSTAPSLSQVVAMYENITVMLQFFFSLMQGLDSDSNTTEKKKEGTTGGADEGDKSGTKGRGAAGGNATLSDSKRDASREVAAAGAASPHPNALRGAASGGSVTRSVGFAAGSGASSPGAEGSAVAAAAAPQDTAQLREGLSQQLVHIVLQIDVHAVVVATSRVLQCDRTLFRVLHQFCVLDARVLEQAKPTVKAPESSPQSRSRRSGSNAFSASDAAALSYSSGGGGLINASRAGTGGSTPLLSGNAPYSGSAATLAPYLSSGSGARGRRGSGYDMGPASAATAAGAGAGAANSPDGGPPVFNAAASFFMTANFGDLRQMVNEVGAGGQETPPAGAAGGGASGELGNSRGSLHGSRGSGLGGSTASANASTPFSRSVPAALSQRRLNRGHGKGKKQPGNPSGGGGGENFAKSFFKSFFGGAKKGAGGLFARGVATDIDGDDDDGDANGGDGGSRDYDSSSRSSSSSSRGSSGSSDDSSGGDDDVLDNTIATSGSGSPPTPRSFAAASSMAGGRRHNTSVGSPRRLPLLAAAAGAAGPSSSGQTARKGHKRRHRHRSRTRAKPLYSPWRDVPSYTALVSELVRVLNLVLADAALSIDVRLGAGLLLPSVVLRDSQVFRLYEGRVLIRNYMSLLLHELQHYIKLRTTAAATAGDEPAATAPPPPQQLSGDSAAGTTDGSVVHGRAHLTQRELIAFAPRVIEALEQTFKVLGATPLTSDAASLTELPLYFFCADGRASLGIALERSFTRVVVLWLIGLVGAQCDEDIDRHAMEVLLHLMNRAVTRGSLPKDSGTTLMLNAAGTATVVQISPVSGAAVPTAVQGPPGTSSADWVDSRRLLAGAAGDDIVSVGALSPQLILSAAAGGGGDGATTSGTFTASAASIMGGPLGVSSSTAAAPLAPLGDDDSADLGGLYRSHINNSLFDNTEFIGLAAAAGVDRAMAECGNTVEALGSVFRVLLGRSPDLLTPSGLATVLALFASHDSNVSRLGRECMTRSLETPSSYALYADVIRDSDTFALTQTLSVISAYLNSAALTTTARHERRVWLQRSGCVDAVVRVLMRVLDSPQSTPTFMKVIPHLFQLLSAFESVDHKAPQLSSTNFVAAVTERLEKLEGVEYFIIITQAVLDSCMGTYGGVDSGYANYGGPGAHYTEMQVIGNFHVAQHNCAAEKPVFLELLPSLLRFAERNNTQLYRELVEVIFRVLECTGNVRSDRLADFILDHGLSQMLPYLELSGAYIEERLPFTGSATELHRFWQPVLLRAPRRSELRFTAHGGVQVSVGTWPDSGFTIAAWFKFDRLYTTIPLFEFHGVMSDASAHLLLGGGDHFTSGSNRNNASGSGHASPAPQRGTTALTALLSVFGGDSVQLSLNDARRTTVNESQALQNFAPSKWLHVCAVLRSAQVLDVYVSGFKVGSAGFPALLPGSEVRVNVGYTDEQPHSHFGAGTGAGVAPLFSISDVTLWAHALNRAQVEAELASSDCRAMGSEKPVAPAKIMEEAIPQELTIVRHAGTASAAAGVGGGGGAAAAGLLAGGNFAGFAALMNTKGLTGAGGGGAYISANNTNAASLAASHDSRGAVGVSLASSAGGHGDYDDLHSAAGGAAAGGLGGSYGQSWLPIATRIARFVPYENDDNLLRNVLAGPTAYPVVAKLVGRYAAPPKTWVDYPLLWATRGGVMRLLDWFHLVTSSAQLEGLLQLLTECIQRTTLTVTLDPRTYMLFAFMLTNHVAAFVTKAACDQLLALASSHITVFDEEHRIVINRMAFEHILGSVAFYAAIPVDAALYLLQRVRRLFHGSQCRYARHNARFIIPYRFVDHLLHSLVDVATRTALELRCAVVQVAQQVVVACDMEEGLVQIFVSLVAQLTPDEMLVVSRHNPHVKVVLPAMGFMTHGKTLPLRTANHLTTLLFSSLVECTSQSAFVAALARTVDLPWYASCLSRFADPAGVVFATRLFFEAVEHNPALHEEAMQHQSAIIEALMVHAGHEDLVLLLLALTVGAARHVDVLSRKHSLLQQLDSVMTSFTAHPNSLVAPIFVRIFVVHLNKTVQAPKRQAVKSAALLIGDQRLSFRVRRYFSLARVCSRLMILIRVRRYRALLLHHPIGSAAGSPELTPAAAARYHARVRSGGVVSSPSGNMSFAHSGATATTTTVLGNLSFASNAAAHARRVATPLPMPGFAVSALGVRGDTMGSMVEGGGPLQPVSPQAPSLAGRSSVGGLDGYADDGETAGNRSVTSGHGDARQRVALLTPRDGALGGEEDADGGVEEAVPQWKPPVLLPDMWAVPAPLHAAANGEHSTAVRSSADISRASPPMSLLTSPTTSALPRQATHVSEAGMAGSVPPDTGSGDDNAEMDDARASSQFYVHSRKHKRAFAVLRVCVLLWLPLQVRRSRWIFTPHTQPYEEDYAKRHASTLFCIRMFRHFASLSSNFYLFVNSPLQTGALSALVAYISRDMLVEETDTWDDVIRAMVVAPARETAALADTTPGGEGEEGGGAEQKDNEGAVLVSTPTTYESSATPATVNLVDEKVTAGFGSRGGELVPPPPPPVAAAVEEREAEKSEDRHDSSGGGVDPLFETASPAALPRVLSVPPRKGPRAGAEDNGTAADGAAEQCPPPPSAGAAGAVMNDPPHTPAVTDTTQQQKVLEPLPGTPRSPPMTQPRSSGATRAADAAIAARAPLRLPPVGSMTFRSVGSSSAQLDQMTVLESPDGSVRFADEDEDGVTGSAGPPSRLRRHRSEEPSLPNASFDQGGPPSTQMTRVPLRRLQQQRQQQQQQQQQTSANRQASAMPTQTSAISVVDTTSRPAEGALPPFLEEAAAAAAATATDANSGTALAEESSPLVIPRLQAPAAPASGARPEAAETLETPQRAASSSLVDNGGDDDEEETGVRNRNARMDDEDDDDGSSSVSSAASFASASSQSSTASTTSVPTNLSSAGGHSSPSYTSDRTLPSSSMNMASAKKAVTAAVPSFANLPDVPSLLRGHDPSDAYAINMAKIAASVGEVVRRDAVSILRALIRSSLDTLPVPHWISGPTYGSCGGLLFQMLLIVSAKATADDATTTLVRYFLLNVGNAVKEQRDREMLPQRHDAPQMPGLGNASFAFAGGGGGGGVGVTPLGSRGVSGYPDPQSGSAGFNASPGLTNMSFTSPGLPGGTAFGGASTTTVTNASFASGSPMYPNSMQHSAFLGASTASSPFGLNQRHNVPPGQQQQQRFATGAGSPLASQNLHVSSLSGSGTFSDVFLFNVNHFTDLIVDMLAINVLDLPMATHYFLTLLVVCQGWPSRYIDQLSGQVMRACIAVLNRPSMQDASVGLIESVYTLTTLVLRRGWKRKGVLECLFRVLYRIYGSLPPAWMSDEDARHRRRLISLIFRHIVETYRGTKELEKALTVRTLTLRLSLYDDFVMIFSLPSAEESNATFEQYSLTQSSSLETLMAGRLKAKADLAFKASIKTRSEYIKRIKVFNSQYVQVSEVADRYRKTALRGLYGSRFSSYVATTPVVDASQLHWLLTPTCALRDDRNTASSDTQRRPSQHSGEATLYHFLDAQDNYGEFKSVVWGKERARGRGASQLFTAVAPASAGGIAASPSPQNSAPGSPRAGSSGSRHDSNTASPLNRSGYDSSRRGSVSGAADGGSFAAAVDDDASRNDLVRAAQCEEVVQHVAVLLPPFSTRCRPHLGDATFTLALKDLSITLTPSAMTLLRYLLAPHETLRFISNGFRINGIHATPCLILLTNTTLKVIGFSRVTEGGDIILCENDDEDAEEAQVRANNTAMPGQDSAKSSPLKASRKNYFSVASMTKQFQKLFSDSATKLRQQQDGTRVAQAVRQVMGRNYQNIFWSYLVSSIRAVRSLRYMHLDTAVQLDLAYDSGPMLSVVDARQSMNPSARKEFLKVLREVVAPQQCTFSDESQRAASMKTNLVRWATGALSNFEYLRFLNEMAGRTNHDLNQYPVYPWVLADYTSTTLDLESAATFRNLGYPMGAQTEARRNSVAQLFENTREVCDPDTGKSYPFHHGTHYSTSGAVLYFLLRVQPFTTFARLFQGGDFDLAMRLFDSVAASFTSCVTGPADCKELIPEFYTNNSFLANADRLPLGVKSDGEPVDDVRLPPWAKGSRQVFTAVMRYALESCMVVDHLHQWIDLVFGVRRRGPLAMERYNVFQRMTYGEEVAQALKDAETPRDCDVIIAEVDNFGQTPQQLFQERHPSHQELVPVVQGFSSDGSGGGVNNSSIASGGGVSTGGGGGGAGGRGGAPGSGSVSAVTLGGLYTSSHAASGAGTHLGSNFSNLLSSGTFASGQTYTLAFRRESPKVVRMLIHAMDEAQAWFVLRDPPSGMLQHPPPPALLESFQAARPAVLHFTPLHTSRKLACSYAQLVPVPDTDHYLCWYEREARLMRYSAGQAMFQTMVAFNPPDESGAHISAVAVGARESVLLMALSTGAIYCLFPDDTLNGALHLRMTLCHHRHPVEKIALDPVRHRAVSLTRGHSDDEPILWRVQRSGCGFLARLSVGQLLPMLSDAELARTGQTAEGVRAARSAVDAAVDAVSGHIAVVTARSLLLFDNNGEPFGAGTLPSPSSARGVDSVLLEDDNGDVGVVVGRAVVLMPDLHCVAFYNTSEWAAGMSVLVTGHVDGSLSVWRCTRLPPDTVQPGKIAMVEFHARLFSGAAAGAGNVVGSLAGTAAGGVGPDYGGPAAASGGSGGRAGSLARKASPPATGAGSQEAGTPGSASASPANAALGAGAASAGPVGTGTGSTNCPVTCLYQERVDVPTFLVGYENGTIRQLVFEDPALMAAGGGGGGGAAGSGRDGGAGDERSQRR